MFIKKKMIRKGLDHLASLTIAICLTVVLSCQARAWHWEAYTPHETKVCASGEECAIWQSEQITPSHGRPYRCENQYTYFGYLSQVGCYFHVNATSEWGGISVLKCDADEVRDSSGCHKPIGKAKPDDCTKTADPVLANQGVLYENVTDYSVGQSSPLTFERTYWSDLSTNAGPAGQSRLGQGWHSNFDVGATFYGDKNSPSDIYVVKSDGTESYFVSRSNGYVLMGSNPTSGNSGYVAGTPLEKLSKNDNGWTYVDANDTSFALDVAGHLQNITYRSGYQQTLTWVANQNTKVSDNLGRQITFTYDANGHITTLTSSDGQSVGYSYTNVAPFPAGSSAASVAFSTTTGSSYVLSGVTYPGADSNNVQYQYADTRFPWALTGKIDERGVLASTWTYDINGRVSQNALAGGVGTYSFSYDTANKKTTVTNPLGKQTVYHYNPNVPGSSLLTQIEGVTSSHCAASNATLSYDNSNFLSQVVDGEGRTTTYVNDGAGRPTSVTQGAGTPLATTTTTTWHPTFNVPSQIVQPNLKTDFTWSATGQLTQVTQTDTTSQTKPFSTAGRVRSWAYTYGTGGLLASVDGPLPGSGDTVSYTNVR